MHPRSRPWSNFASLPPRPKGRSGLPLWDNVVAHTRLRQSGRPPHDRQYATSRCRPRLVSPSVPSKSPRALPGPGVGMPRSIRTPGSWSSSTSHRAVPSTETNHERSPAPPLSRLPWLPSAFRPAAEKADRDKPMLVEAGKGRDRSTAKRSRSSRATSSHHQGHADMVLRGRSGDHHRRPYGFQKGTAFSGKKGLALFPPETRRQGRIRRRLRPTHRIRHHATEVAELFHRAWVKSGEDQVVKNRLHLVRRGE